MLRDEALRVKSDSVVDGDGELDHGSRSDRAVVADDRVLAHEDPVAALEAGADADPPVNDGVRSDDAVLADDHRRRSGFLAAGGPAQDAKLIDLHALAELNVRIALDERLIRHSSRPGSSTPRGAPGA